MMYAYDDAIYQPPETDTAHKAHVAKVIGILQDWWKAKQDGSANSRFPSITCDITQDEADKQIKALDDWSESEFRHNWSWHQSKNGTGKAWNFFDYLEPHARLTMTYDLWKVAGIIE